MGSSEDGSQPSSSNSEGNSQTGHPSDPMICLVWGIPPSSTERGVNHQIERDTNTIPDIKITDTTDSSKSDTDTEEPILKNSRNRQWKI